MCSVRQSAVDRVMGLREKLKNKKVMVTGCILKKDKLKLEKEFGKIIEINKLIGKVKENLSKNIIVYIPIMTGCNNFCSYCVVPYTRGREVSRPQKEIICEIKKLIKNGAKEIWLLGQNVNSYKYNFPRLLRKINKIRGDFWIRFMSSHPKDFSNDLIKAMAECKKVAKYLNLPIQSGSNEILKKMNRPYTVEQYKNLIKKIREKIPNINLSTDVIVGFPGETEKQFKDTVKLFREIKYNIAYINKYSPRSGTASFKLKDDVSPKEKIRRERILKKIIKETKHGK
jgi:tRNA-2-methylthio-N6-dimethylallyladenosine synthase